MPHTVCTKYSGSVTAGACFIQVCQCSTAQCLQVYGFFRNFTESGLALRIYEIHKNITENYMIVTLSRVYTCRTMEESSASVEAA